MLCISGNNFLSVFSRASTGDSMLPCYCTILSTRHLSIRYMTIKFLRMILMNVKVATAVDMQRGQLQQLQKDSAAFCGMVSVLWFFISVYLLFRSYNSVASSIGMHWHACWRAIQVGWLSACGKSLSP